MRQSIAILVAAIASLVSAKPIAKIQEQQQQLKDAEKAVEGKGHCHHGHEHHHHGHEHHRNHTHHHGCPRKSSSSEDCFGHHHHHHDHHHSGILPQHHRNHRHQKPECSHPPSWSSSLDLPDEENTHVKIKPNKGWYPFVFGNSQTDVPFDFSFHSKRATILTVADAFCSGDYFQFFDNGRLIGETYYNCEGFPYWESDACEQKGCQYYTENIEEAIYNGNHCYGVAVLIPGYHNITLQTLLSCETAGTAYIRVDKACWNYNDYGLANDLVPCCALRQGCNTHINDYFNCRSRSSSSSSSSSSEEEEHVKPCHGHNRHHHHGHHHYHKNDEGEEKAVQ